MTEPAPSKPILALTLGLVGKRQIAASDLERMEGCLTLAFDAIGERLGQLRAGIATGHELAARFTDSRAARLTLITGLADGADQIAGRLFVAPRSQREDVERVLGAVLPCSAGSFVSHSPVSDEPSFRAAADCCAFVIELDGIMAPATIATGGKGSEAARTGHRERARAFAAQAEILLRNADLLVAIDDPEDEGRIGGTRRSVERALDQGIAVILLRLGESGLSILRSREHFDEPRPMADAVARQALGALVDELVGVAASQAAGAEWDEYEHSMLAEVFAPEAPEPGMLVAFWSSFESWFKTRAPRTRDEAPLAYSRFRARASALSAYYAGLYRGSFLLGYVLAVVAVTMAVASLAILLVGLEARWPVETVELVLLSFGALKLAAVVTIARLGEMARKQRLAYRATDYRYLSERLRAMIFLPHAGSLRASFDWSPPYATRIASPGVLDHLFQAILRQAEPLTTLPGAVEGRTVRPRPAEALAVIREGWLRGQLRYHVANARTHEAMKNSLDSIGRVLNAIVVTVVAADLALIVLGLLGWLPSPVLAAVRTWAAPALVAIAAVLPAAVASLNGIRFQSEVARLAERSEQMAANLTRLEHLSFPADPRPARLIGAMRLGDDVARLAIQDVVEWAAIYGKEFVEM